MSEAARVWLKIGCLGFGGPAGQIALLHREVVERRGWIDEHRFLHALSFCTLLPGPEAQQLATYLGWLMHRTIGGLVAGTLFVLPGALAILGLSVLYASFQQVPAVAALLLGLKAAVLAVVVEALVRVGRRALGGPLARWIALAAFGALFFFAVPFPLVIAAAAAVGIVGRRFGAGVPGAVPPLADGLASPRPTLGRSLRMAMVGLAVWLLPLVGLSVLFGRESVFAEQGWFFSKTAVVTFGGAYAVLAYVAQRAVETYGWLAPGQMVDALGLAETTPGPLILVLQFVAFLGAYHDPGGLSPLVAGCLGSAVALWATFAPCFLWIFLGAPWIEALRGVRWLQAALAAITAAVVGVIANLSLWFALHVLFRVVRVEALGPLQATVPEWGSVDFAAVALAALAFLALFRWKLGLLPTLGLSAALGLVLKLAPAFGRSFP